MFVSSYYTTGVVNKSLIFHTKYPKHFRASLRSIILSASSLTWNPGSAPDNPFLSSFMTYHSTGFETRLTRRISLFHKYCRVHVAQSLVDCVAFCASLYVRLSVCPFVIALSILLWFTASGSSNGISIVNVWVCSTLIGLFGFNFVFI